MKRISTRDKHGETIHLPQSCSDPSLPPAPLAPTCHFLSTNAFATLTSLSKPLNPTASFVWGPNQRTITRASPSKPVKWPSEGITRGSTMSRITHTNSCTASSSQGFPPFSATNPDSDVTLAATNSRSRANAGTRNDPYDEYSTLEAPEEQQRCVWLSRNSLCVCVCVCVCFVAGRGISFSIEDPCLFAPKVLGEFDSRRDDCSTTINVVLAENV